MTASAALFLSTTARRCTRALRQGSGALADASALFLRRCFGAGLLFQSVVLYTLKVLRPCLRASGQRRALGVPLTCTLMPVCLAVLACMPQALPSGVLPTMQR